MAATTKSSTPLTKTLSVRLERDPAVESLLLPAPQNHDHEDHQVEDKNSSSSDCVICGKSGLRNSNNLQRHREEKEYFKSILINPQVRSTMSSKAYAKFQENFTTCVSCLAIIKEVWAFHKKMAAIQLDIDELVEEARQKTVKTISQGIDNAQKATSSTSSIPVNQGITPRIGKELKKLKSDQKMMSVPKIKAEDAAEDFNSGIKKEEDSEDVKVKKEDEIGESDHHHEHCKNNTNIREQILSRRLTLRSLINVRRIGHKKCAEKPVGKIRSKTVPTTSSTSRKAKSKTKIANSEKVKKIRKQRRCSKCGKLFSCVSQRLQHELQKCKVHYTTKELEQWKDFIHKCTFCGHFLPSKCALQLHIHAHNGVKPFCCPRCKKRFTHNWYMKAHFENNRCFSKFTGRKSKLFIQNANCDDHAE